MLKARDLTYKSILKGISLEFPPGMIHGILGLNGAGKTTFLKTLAGLLPLTYGTVSWLGQDLLSLPRRDISKIITYVPQNPPIPFDFTVEQFVEMGFYPYAKKPQQLREALERVQALPFATRSINAISQGERQCIYIARALVTEAPILLFDEPTANLDVKHQKRIWDLMKSLAGRGQTIILATHDLEYAKKYCDLVHLLETGCCIASGPFTKAIKELNLV